MSQVYQVDITCPVCNEEFTTSLYLTILADPESRRMILEDEINVPECPACETAIVIADATLLYHDPANQFAVWYDPVEDESIDVYAEGWAEMMGEESYLAKAERVGDWEVFKGVVEGLKSAE